MTDGCIKIKLAFQSPLGGMVRRKRILTFPPDVLLQEVAEVVSGATGAKALWPTSFGEWLRQSGTSLLICFWNISQWEPLPSFAILNDYKSDVSVEEPVQLLFSVVNGTCSGFKSKLGFESKVPDITPLVRKPPLIPRKPKATAKISTSLVSTKESTGSEADPIICHGVISL